MHHNSGNKITLYASKKSEYCDRARYDSRLYLEPDHLGSTLIETFLMFHLERSKSISSLSCSNNKGLFVDTRLSKKGEWQSRLKLPQP